MILLTGFGRNATLCGLLLTGLFFSFCIRAAHPNLVLTAEDVQHMREAIKQKGRFTEAYLRKRRTLDQQIALPIEVPVPQDGGGGYTHERHKRNYRLMYDAGVMYQITQQAKYADFVRNTLVRYAELYPTLALHPKRKVKSQNPGKLFWQSLNEAVWLVYTIQAYDLIYNSLSSEQRQLIEKQLLRPVALFLSEGQPSTFNKVHNHGTWATAGVGMTGYVLGEPEWVEKALYDLQKSGKGGFLRQLSTLFSPQGYYNEGPYYQRYALMPFVTFAKAINNNEPSRKIFEYRDGVLLKAIDTSIQLSYAGLFFPINDAIKSKGIDTIELVHGVTVAYGLTGQPGYLDIAQKQSQIVLTGDGLRVAEGLDNHLEKPYEFKSIAFGDGPDGNDGALVVMRSALPGKPAVLFKPASQGLGHGHFDKLTWQFYHDGTEVVSDYGAARFLNVEAKYGGRYLPENNTYAKQTVAHNTVVIDQTSHFNGKVKVGNRHSPDLRVFDTSERGTLAIADIASAYADVNLKRTLSMVELPLADTAIVIDLFEVSSDNPHQMDLPLHYQGQLIETSFDINANTHHLTALGEKHGYQHLWLKGQGTPAPGMAKVTWLNDNGHFYTQTSLVQGNEAFLFTQIGANDPQFNLRNEQGFIRRVTGRKHHNFVSVLEYHGEYNPAKEFTLGARSQVSGITHLKDGDLTFIGLDYAGEGYLVVINESSDTSQRQVSYQGRHYLIDGNLAAFRLGDQQE